MDGLIFRKAERCESEHIAALYRSVIGRPFCTWNEDYPGEEEICGDFAAESLYVLENAGELIGAVSIVPENELNGFDCWKVKDNAREFARVVIRPDHQHKGLSVRLVEGIMREMRKQQVSAIHISVAKKNIPAKRLYAGMGFDFCDEADMYGHSFFLCEKILKAEK